MKYQFKTNIKCSGCVATVTPALNSGSDIQSWEVNLDDPQKILTVETNQSAAAISELVKKAGYHAEPLNPVTD